MVVAETSRRPRRSRIGWAHAALWIVRLVIAGFAISATFSLLGVSDKSLGNRLQFQEYGYGYPGPNGPVEHNGPWLVLFLDAPLHVCPIQNRPRTNSDPPYGVLGSPSDCRAARRLRSQLGNIDVDGLRLVRQVEGPPESVGRTVSALVLATYGFLLLGAFALERILRLAARGRPFSDGAVFWLRVLAVGAAGVTILLPLLTDRFIDGLNRKYFDAAALEGSSSSITIQLGPILLVLLVLVVAQVWKLGTKLQRDAQATV